jgi:hypothetical protein
MPGDPKECREHAKQCLELAAEALTQTSKERFEQLAQKWLVIAADLEAAQALVKEWSDTPLGTHSGSKRLMLPRLL